MEFASRLQCRLRVENTFQEVETVKAVEGMFRNIVWTTYLQLRVANND